MKNSVVLLVPRLCIKGSQWHNGYSVIYNNYCRCIVNTICYKYIFEECNVCTLYYILICHKYT